MLISIPKSFCLVACALVTICESGCASYMDSRYPWDKAWRLGKVETLGDGGPDTVIHTNCRELMGQNWPYSRVAIVSCSYGSSPTLRHKRLVGVPPNISLALGDKVYVKVDDCATPLQKTQE